MTKSFPGWLSIADHGWLTMPDTRWLSIGDHRWLTMPDHGWLSIPDHAWLSMTRLLTETVTVGLRIVRPPIAASRLVLDDGPVVRYFAKGTVPGKDTQGLFDPESRTFDYLEWMARVRSHIPERGSHLVHYLGAYSDKHRACELAGATESPCTPVAGSEPVSASAWREARRRSWARLIQGVWQTNPLICGKCGGQMKIIAFIDAKEQPEVVAAILGHIKWRFDVLLLPARPPPLACSDEHAGVATDSNYI